MLRSVQGTPSPLPGASVKHDPSTAAAATQEGKGTGMIGNAAGGAARGGEDAADGDGAFTGFGGGAGYLERSGGRSNASCSSAASIPGFSTDLPSELSGKLRVLLVFGQHGREAITTELGFNLLRILVGERELVERGEKQERAEGNKGGISWEQLALIWPHLVITIVPMENVNGRKKVEAGQLCERRNGRGVDINRNWDCDWGVKEQDYNPLEEAPGARAFSEPETEAMRQLAVWFRPHVWVNVHSGMEALFTPLDHRGDGVDAATLAAMHSLLERLDAAHCGGRCVIGSGGGFVGYFAHGTATDWMYDVLQVPLVFTFETFGDESFPTTDCFPLFNPITAEKFQEVVNSWTALFVSFLTLLPDTLNKIPHRMLPPFNFSLPPPPPIASSPPGLPLHTTTHMRPHLILLSHLQVPLPHLHFLLPLVLLLGVSAIVPRLFAVAVRSEHTRRRIMRRLLRRQ
ncbi:hypothetical protein CLOP_g6799 [Closterium sp. NIES-67]|nr:hypothetical protein CLOP_g6799 [Closterium sp. NIES-67]